MPNTICLFHIHFTTKVKSHGEHANLEVKTLSQSISNACIKNYFAVIIFTSSIKNILEY